MLFVDDGNRTFFPEVKVSLSHLCTTNTLFSFSSEFKNWVEYKYILNNNHNDFEKMTC